VGAVLDVTRADLARHTTLRLGGPARRLAVLDDQEEIVQVTQEADNTGESVLVLAGGSNVVIADEGFPGTVLLIRSRGVQVRTGPDTDTVSVTVEAGHPWDDLVAFAVAEGLAGVECLSGVPGSAGATPIQNVGAYGQEVAETISSVRVYDRESATVRDLAGPDCGFGYRNSLFRHNPRYVVLAVTLRLRRAASSGGLGYAELARALGVPVGAGAPLAEVRQAVLELRAGKAMVLADDDPDTYSVGSFFTNPVVDPERYAAVCAAARQVTGGDPVAWPGADGFVKISAAWLIERAGIGKGYRGDHVGVAVSSRHTLALTHRGGGSTAALLGLAREIRDRVRTVFGVDLVAEPVLVGCTL
jgi:UDP-N-acetylmuramate dehydrogenase